MRIFTSKLFLIAALFLTTIIFGGQMCNTAIINDPTEVLTEVEPAVNQGVTDRLKININSLAPPNTNPKEQPDFDIFAWNSFIALNWPAVIPDSSNKFLRGIPDVNKTFANAQPGDLLVWETFKEKREIFNQTKPPGHFGIPVPTLYPWNHPVDYGLLRAADGPGDDIDPNAANTNPTGIRIFHQGRKQMTPFDSFDETAEVGSEVLERTYPDGTKNPVYGRPVGPRVWKGNPSDSLPVVYEVKLNYDYYNYIKANKLYLAPTDETNTEADSADLRLPYRTSAKMGPKGQTGGPKYDIAVNYSSEKTAQRYKQINVSGDSVPPLIGAMQFKAAWVKLNPAVDDIKSYHTAKALFYDSGPNGRPIPHEGLFGLIGLHIIQRIHISNDNGEAEPTGGTFIFATWEHTSLRQKPNATGYTYSNYYNPVVDPGALIRADTFVYKQGFYPPIKKGLPYDGVYPVTAKFNIISNPGSTALGTAEVNKQVHSLLPRNSVWQNYQLVGTQFIAIDVNSASVMGVAGQKPRYPVTELDPQGIGLPVYLANLVIETNQGLQKFQGQPPGTLPIANYEGAGVNVNNTVNFLRNNKNTSFNRVAYNMGGCMGCHGVAQSKGFSFSFVLLGGRDGALTDTETHFEIPPLDSIPRGN